MLEAINENREGCFGWAVEEVYEEHFGRGEEGKPHAYGTSSSSSEKGSASPEKSWQWLPSMYDLKTHYIHELGFLACSFQMFGATVFWISGFTALPGINNNMSQGLLDGIYWVPQVVGGCGFVISGALFMIETQKHWWQPAFGVLGWHIGFWNLIGGIGFTLSPCFGFDTNHWAQYQAGCSTFWASWAFLIGSVIQWYESLDKNPVEVDKS
ncbi:hypothetical protein H2203_007661 [Taxawa tesnikishii (nom. ined.)]|nr:hypothetical protein H2203_007661 [Dothideales sp. JES 119]